MTDPAYRGRGLFQQAARIAYAEMQRRGMQFVWGFPNSQIHRQRRRDLGWLTIAEIPMLRLKLSESSPSKRRPRPAQPVRSIGPAFDDLWRRLRDRHRLITRRDAAHLHWRYLANPGATYRILTLDGRDGLAGYCVVKLYQNEFQIVDILADDDDTFADLVDSVVRIAKEENAPSVALWYNVHDLRHLLLESMGFTNDSPVTYLSGTSQFGERDPESDAGCPIWLDYRNWYITMGDSDVF
jgi:hypothetical protein